MIYRISYDNGMAATNGGRLQAGGKRTEHFHSEREALRRARELIEAGDHHAVALHDGSGEALAGIRLQLRLGASTAD